MKTQSFKKLNALIPLLLALFLPTIIHAQWQSKSSGFSTPKRNIVDLIAVDDNVAWAIAGDAINPIFEIAPMTDFTVTTDGGAHWNAGNIKAFSNFFLVAMAPVSASICYASMANFDNGTAKVVKTTDGGVTWTEQLSFDFGQSFGFFADIYFFNANDGILYGDQNDGYFTIYTTKNGGSTWTRVPKANMPAALNADEASYVFSAEGIGNTFWTVSTSGRVWKTTDKGMHWKAYATDEGNIEFSNLKMRDTLHGLWGVHGELYSTNDGAETWTEVEFSGTWFTNDLAYVPGTTGTYVSTGAHDFPGYAENGSLHGIGSSYSLDNGNTWITIDTGVEHPSIAMVNAYTGYTGGINTTGSTGMYRYNGSAFGYSCGNNLTEMCQKGRTICVANSAIQSHLSKGAALGECASIPPFAQENLDDLQLSIYPNPALSNESAISFSLEQSTPVSVKIFDTNGRLISTLAARTFEAGKNEVVWNLDKVNSGIYILQIQSGGHLRIEKIIVNK